MRRGRTEGSSRRPYPAGVAYSREFLDRLARILVQSGHSPKKLAREFADICRQLKEPTRPWDPARLNYIADLPHVIAHWHADTQYLDSRGLPMALPLRERGPSLVKLISRVLPHADPLEVFDSLVKLGGVRRRGTLYLPTGRYLAFNQQRNSALAHGLTALLGMLRTVEHNVSSNPRRTVLERAAINPSLPVSALPSLHKRLKSMAAKFLWQVDGAMRRRESRRRAVPTKRVGVGVFAFEDPFVSGTARTGSRPRARTNRTEPRR